MSNMEKTYSPHSFEKNWYDHWEEKGYFAPSGKGAGYCIMIPPPNVTGSLHMGHAFQNTLMDILIRYHRMLGHNTLWQVGTDHAGIATQMVVERQLAAQGTSRQELGREAFVEKVWQWKTQSGNTITRQLRRLGSSLDWSRERFTMDDGLSEAVLDVFIQLYDEGLIYRGNRLVNWDPVLHTAISDLEVLNQEEKGSLWHMRYPLSDGSGHLVVATTRPETMLGDTAVAVHPDDDRYKAYHGKSIRLPLCDRDIPIITDDYVDPEFGSGCVKITPAHDFNDYEMGQRHNLPMINIFTIDACINDQAPKAYAGMDRFDARKKILQDLKAQDLLEKTENHTLKVPRGDRSGTVIEPFLTNQWYVKIHDLAQPAIKAVEDGDIKFVPANWSNTYFEWMRNIQDWCISRQLWWGHRIPAWYDDEGNIYVARDEKEVRKKYKLDDRPLKQDDDVLDTWFSSALWPFSTLGWPQEKQDLDAFYPTNVLVTGFDIIFFWVARMIMAGLKFTDKIPFHEIYIHGLVRDSHGQKMSKSKGNILDPIDIIDGIDLETLVKKRTTGLMQPEMAPEIEKITREDFSEGILAYGTDPLRFTFAALASTGRDINFDMKRIEGYRNFCNKLWNASRYVMMNCEDKTIPTDSDYADFSVADRWIWSRLNKTIEKVQEHFKIYRFDLAAQNIYEFTWNEYCDWYVELSKPILNSSNAKAAAATRQTLVQVLECLLRLSHPIIPFITEEIWQKLAPLAGRQGETIMLQDYPQAQKQLSNEDAEEELQWIMDFVLGVRKIRSGYNIAPGKALPVILQNASSQDQERFQNNETYIATLAKLDQVSFLGKDEKAPDAATALLGDMRILIPMAGFIDKEAEGQRLKKELEKLQKEKQKAEGKLNNEKFTAKAPKEVVEQEKTRLVEFNSQIKQIQEQLTKIENI